MMKFDDIPNSRINEIVDEYIHSERDRCLLKDRWINGYTYEKLGEMLRSIVSKVSISCPS